MSNETQKPAAKPDGNSIGAMRSWIIIAVAVALFFTFYKTNPGEPAVHELTQTYLCADVHFTHTVCVCYIHIPIPTCNMFILKTVDYRSKPLSLH